jgi:hypothetical protein
MGTDKFLKLYLDNYEGFLLIIIKTVAFVCSSFVLSYSYTFVLYNI